MNRENGVVDAVLSGVSVAGAGVAKTTLMAVSMIFAGVMAGHAVEPSRPNAYSESGMLGAARGNVATSADQPVNIGIPPPDELRVLEARREAELKRLSEKLKRLEARAPQPAPTGETPAWVTDVAAAPADELPNSDRYALGAGQSQPENRGEPKVRGRATILMVMAPRERRGFNSDGAADPILCVAEGCYVSNGTQAPATYHSFHQSLGIGGRIGRGAGACNHALACVFRNVDLGGDTAMVQPIDLKFVHHDRREQSEVAIDTSCRVIDGGLSCNRPVRTATYTLWVVPEGVARDVGPDMIATALSSGLRPSRTAELPWMQN